MPAPDRPVDPTIFTEKPGDTDTTFVLIDDERPTEVEMPEEKDVGFTASAPTTDADILDLDENGAVLTDDAGREAEANENNGKVDLIEAFINSNPALPRQNKCRGKLRTYRWAPSPSPRRLPASPWRKYTCRRGSSIRPYQFMRN
jgi:hypothetical protein